LLLQHKDQLFISLREKKYSPSQLWQYCPLAKWGNLDVNRGIFVFKITNLPQPRVKKDLKSITFLVYLKYSTKNSTFLFLKFLVAAKLIKETSV
jgi:hypothetical protein